MNRKDIRVYKRSKKSSEDDGRIICDEMMKRYGIDLVKMKSPFAEKGKEYNLVQKAWEATKKDHKAGKIGAWRKKNTFNYEKCI